MSNQGLKRKSNKIPLHIAIIMDGNGRWAAVRGLPRLAGHRAGTENLREVIRATAEFGVRYLTIYAFSTENWGRPKDEISGLMHILEDVIDRELAELNKEGVQLRHIGHLEGLSPLLQKKVKEAIELSKNNNRLTLSLAFNYGGRDEITCAVRRMIEDGIQASDVTQELINSYLFTSCLPDPDLIIRTSGEKRVSNFLIWQGAYAELYITDVLWPDFGRDELLLAIKDYESRDRRFGRLSDVPRKPGNAS